MTDTPPSDRYAANRRKLRWIAIANTLAVVVIFGLITGLVIAPSDQPEDLKVFVTILTLTFLTVMGWGCYTAYKPLYPTHD